MNRSSGVSSAWPIGSGQAGAPDDDPPSPEEAAVRSLEWTVLLARRAAEADRRRRLRAVEVELAEQEHRARRDAERQQHAMRVELARSRFAANSGPREPPTVDLARLDVRELRIQPL